MGLMSKILGGSDDEDENSEEELGFGESSLEPEQEVVQQETQQEQVQQETEQEKVEQEEASDGPENSYGIPDEEMTGIDETLMEVDSPVNYIASKGVEQREKLFENSRIAQELQGDVVNQVRNLRGAHQTARTANLWAKNLDADEIVDQVAEQAGISSDEVYEDMSSEKKESLMGELVDRELYSAADSFATSSDSIGQLTDVIQSRFADEFKDEYADGERDTLRAISLSEDEKNAVMALKSSLSSEVHDEFDMEEHVGISRLRANHLGNESSARHAETQAYGTGNSARKAVKERWDNEEYDQAALIAETFDVDSIEVEDESSYSDRTIEVDDVAAKVVDKHRKAGNYEEAVELAGEQPGGVERTELLEKLSRHVESDEEAFEIATAGYTGEEVMDSAIDYVEQEVQGGNTEAYEALESAAGYDIQEELSPEAQTDLQLAGL